MSRKKIQDTPTIDPFYEGKEFSVEADKLLAAIDKYLTRIKGHNPTSEQLYNDACAIIRSRIK